MSFNPNANPVTLTQTVNGIITLTATITNDCSNQSASKPITVGSPAPTSINLFPWNGTHFGANLVYEFSVNPISGITNYQWSVAGHANTIISGQGTNMIELLTQNITHDSASLYLTVKWQNSCGWSGNLVREGVIFPSGGAQIIIGPNPTQNVLNITTASNSLSSITNNVKSMKSNYENQASNKLSIKAVLIYNLNGVLIKQQEFGIGTVQAQISIGDFKNGTYIIKTITYDNYAESHLVNVIK